MSASPDSKNSDWDSREKPVPTFSHPALGTADFSANAHRALADMQLQHALHISRDGFIARPRAVYGRAGEPCERCGSPIEWIRLAGRGTSYCPHCQPLRPETGRTAAPLGVGRRAV